MNIFYCILLELKSSRRWYVPPCRGVAAEQNHGCGRAVKERLGKGVGDVGRGRAGDCVE